MDMVTCPSCGSYVRPGSDGLCPICEYDIGNHDFNSDSAAPTRRRGIFGVEGITGFALIFLPLIGILIESFRAFVYGGLSQKEPLSVILLIASLIITVTAAWFWVAAPHQPRAWISKLRIGICLTVMYAPVIISLIIPAVLPATSYQRFSAEQSGGHYGTPVIPVTFTPSAVARARYNMVKPDEISRMESEAIDAFRDRNDPKAALAACEMHIHEYHNTPSVFLMAAALEILVHQDPSISRRRLGQAAYLLQAEPPLGFQMPDFRVQRETSQEVPWGALRKIEPDLALSIERNIAYLGGDDERTVEIFKKQLTQFGASPSDTHYALQQVQEFLLKSPEERAVWYLSN